MKNLLKITAIVVFCCATLAGCHEELSSYINSLATKHEKRNLNKFEQALIYTGFNSMWIVGYPLYPEAAEILKHYLHGDGRDLTVSNSYIKNSYFVKKIIDMKGPGTHRIFFRQHNDWRLSYALNPFLIKIKKSGEINIWQKIVFPKDKSVKARLNIFGREIKVNDSLIYSLNPKTFTAHVEPWNYKTDFN